MILRSPTKIFSIYHRLMFGMIVADVMSSIAMGLTSIPLPKDFLVEDGGGISITVGQYWGIYRRVMRRVSSSYLE